jgi:glycosyltransferase involved in cell wall biosynthesis
MSNSISTSAPTPAKRISIVTPFYNEAGMVAIYFERLAEVLRPLADRIDFEFVCVNDGSRDATVRELQATQPPFGRMVVVDLSRNFGKEAALSAGLDFATGDAVIPMDADLQDPPELVPQMIDRWLAGTPVVLAVRTDRSADGWVKRSTSAAFYAVHNHLADTPIPPNAGDFRLIDRRVADVVRALPERQRFMKGLLSWAGFPAETLPYARPPRASGRTKWNYAKLLNLAIEGITSFSTAPLRASTVLGALFALVAMLYGGFILVRTLVFGVDLPGYASVFVGVVFMGGVQLLSLGVLGEYVGRIYMESKQRPVYVVRAVVERGAGSASPPAPSGRS